MHALPDPIADRRRSARGSDRKGCRDVGRERARRSAAERRDRPALAGARERSAHQDAADLADEIAAAAAELGAATDLRGLQMTQVAIDALSIPDVMPFWKAVLAYETFGDTLVDPRHEGPTVWFQQMDAPRPERNRIHIDVYLPHDQAEARIEAALAAGGRVVYEGHAPHWWTIADPEGNEVDVAPWPDREDGG